MLPGSADSWHDAPVRKQNFLTCHPRGVPTSFCMEEAFPQTRWSMIAAVRSGGDGTGAKGVGRTLPRLLVSPVCLRPRHRPPPGGCRAIGTQDFFAFMLETDFFVLATPALGRLRSFLLTAFKHDLIDHRRRQSAARRGGGQELVPLHEAERRFLAELSTPSLPPDEAWDRRWAIALLDEAMERVRTDFVEGGKAALFESRPLDHDQAGRSAYDARVRSTA